MFQLQTKSRKSKKLDNFGKRVEAEQLKKTKKCGTTQSSAKQLLQNFNTPH